MKICRLIYEEIDAEDKYNPDKNKKISCQQTISDYELRILDDKSNVLIDLTKQKLLDELISKI